MPSHKSGKGLGWEKKGVNIHCREIRESGGRLAKIYNLNVKNCQRAKLINKKEKLKQP